jgi:hypothetical protein
VAKFRGTENFLLGAFLLSNFKFKVASEFKVVSESTAILLATHSAQCE